MGANYTSSSYCTEESSTNSVTNMFTLKMYPALGTLNIHNFYALHNTLCKSITN